MSLLLENGEFPDRSLVRISVSCLEKDRLLLHVQLWNEAGRSSVVSFPHRGTEMVCLGGGGQHRNLIVQWELWLCRSVMMKEMETAVTGRCWLWCGRNISKHRGVDVSSADLWLTELLLCVCSFWKHHHLCCFSFFYVFLSLTTSCRSTSPSTHSLVLDSTCLLLY